MYIAVSVEVEPGKLYAYAVKLSEADNIKTKLESIGGLMYGNVCPTKKRAAEVVNGWNEAYNRNGSFAFANPAF